MKKVLILYGLLVLAIAIFFFARGGSFFNFNFNGNNNSEVSKATAKVGNKTYKLILAKTDSEKVKGLSERDSLPKDQGMLFIFKDKAEYGFWMKNMKFPIDILYISDNKIVEIVENAPAPDKNTSPSNLPVYKPAEAVNYVLELNANEVKENKVKKGESVEFKGL